MAQRACVRYKVFLDQFFRKKSLVDAIFRAGHWNEALAHKFGESVAGGLVPSQSALTPEETSHARSLRRLALQERMRRKKWLHASHPGGDCQNCGWKTQWDEPAFQLLTQCWVCEKLVCKRWCSLAEHARP